MQEKIWGRHATAKQQTVKYLLIGQLCSSDFNNAQHSPKRSVLKLSLVSKEEIKADYTLLNTNFDFLWIQFSDSRESENCMYIAFVFHVQINLRRYTKQWKIMEKDQSIAYILFYPWWRKKQMFTYGITVW